MMTEFRLFAFGDWAPALDDEIVTFLEREDPAGFLMYFVYGLTFSAF